jgi:hypothetical protein
MKTSGNSDLALNASFRWLRWDLLAEARTFTKLEDLDDAGSESFAIDFKQAYCDW